MAMTIRKAPASWFSSETKRLREIVVAAQDPAHIRNPLQHAACARAAHGDFDEAPRRVLLAAESMHQGLRRDVVLHDGIDAFDVLAHRIGGVHGSLQLPLRQERRDRQQRRDSKRQLPVQYEQGAQHDYQLQQRLQLVAEQVLQRARQGEHLGVEHCCEMTGRNLVEMAQRQALHHADEKDAQVAIHLVQQVGLDDGQHVAGQRRRGKQQNENDEPAAQRFQPMLNKARVNQVLDG